MRKKRAGGRGLRAKGRAKRKAATVKGPALRAGGARGTTLRRTRKGQAIRWNPDPEEVQRSVVKLVLSLIEFLRKLMERQAVRRLEDKTLTTEEIERVGAALMKLEETVALIAKRFKLDPRDLNLDLGPIGKLH